MRSWWARTISATGPVDADVVQQVGADRRVAADRRPVLLGQRAPALHDAVRQREPPDVVQQPGGVGELLVALAHPDVRGDVARELGDRGAVARGALVALVQRADQRRQHAPGQVRVLPVRSRATTTSRIM